MKKRIFRWFSVLICISVFITAFLVQSLLYIKFTANMKDEMIFDAEIIAHAVDAQGIKYLENLGYGQSERRVTLIAQDGTVLFDNSNDQAEMENHLNRPEVLEAQQDGTSEGVHMSKTVNEETWYYATKLQNGEVLRIARSRSSFFSASLSILPTLLLLLVLVLGVAMILTSKFTKKLVSSLNAINPDKLEGENLYDELSPLISTIKKQSKLIKAQGRDFSLQRQEFKTMTDHMKEGLLILDRDLNVLSYNKSALSFLEISEEEAREKETLLEFDRSSFVRNAVSSASMGRAQEEILKKGEQFLLISVNPVIVHDRVEGNVLTIFDVTEKQNREQMRREFTANVSHELKTPLTSISGYAEILMNGLVKPLDVPSCSKKIYNEAQRLILLVGDIMELSRLDENGTGFVLESVNFSQLCTEVLQRLSEYAGKKQVTLVTDIEPVQINGVITVLDEMVYNLCENAIKYNKPGGKVNVALKNRDRNIVLKVSDTGIGIAKAEQERIFERFYRVDKSREQTEGTGLGLSIVKHAANLHNAKLNLVSFEGKGSVVSVIFQK